MKEKIFNINDITEATETSFKYEGKTYDLSPVDAVNLRLELYFSSKNTVTVLCKERVDV